MIERKKEKWSTGREEPIKQESSTSVRKKWPAPDVVSRRVKRLTVKLIESFKVIGIDNAEVNKS